MRKGGSVMAGTKKTRRRHRPVDFMTPVSFSMTGEMSRSLAIKDRAALDGLMSGPWSVEGIGGLECIAVVQTRLLQAAAAAPDAHCVPVDALRGVLQVLERDVLPAVAAVRARWSARTGMVCRDDERAALATLADIADQTREALPRRMHLDAYRRAIAAPELMVAEGALA